MVEQEKQEEKSAFEMMAEDIRKIRNSLENLEKAGINTELMVLYINRDSKVNITQVRAVLDSQKKFFKEAVR